ncbi:hypothetical protein E3N88_09593 [Mikania micrantha]|uniref:Uncharacterized protein n=1 Tax=Mikania micrantha TaxID=192012 RepID=A0A5N6PKD1_9ASTR|nr:hypothetical protein E3N88_09593 [Mikania micrantha]
MEVDSKALWLTQMAIPNSIIHAFKKCKSAKELWNSLQQMYKGSEDVKENKKDMLKQKFENFCQENNEKMVSQYLRYVQLVDELTVAGVKMENQDNYQPIYHSNSTPIITFPETPTPSTSHSNPFSSSTPLLTSGQGAFMVEDTNYFHLCEEDLDGIPADDLEETNIDYQMAMISYRAKKFYQRTGRQFKKHNMKNGFGQPNHKAPSSSNCANIAEQHDFSDWSFQAEEASISNNALMANNSNSTFKVIDDMCTPECSENLNAYKRFNAQVCDELESIKVIKANFFKAERNYKQKI